MRPTVLAVAAAMSLSAAAQVRAPLPRVEVHAGGHYLQTAGGRPFFWLGDTAWQLIHSTTREECSYYLHTRAGQGFTVIQAVVLAEFDGVRTPSARGLRPFVGERSDEPNEAYFDRVVEIVDEAASWASTWRCCRRGATSSRRRGEPVRCCSARTICPSPGATRSISPGKLKDRTNVIWMLGGDRPPRVDGPKDQYPTSAGCLGRIRADEDWIPIWREMAAGIAEGLGRRPVVFYHPNGGPQSTSLYLHQESWLSVNGMQSGHGSGHDVPVWEWIARDRGLTPVEADPGPRAQLRGPPGEPLAPVGSGDRVLPRPRRAPADLSQRVRRGVRRDVRPPRDVAVRQRAQRRDQPR